MIIIGYQGIGKSTLTKKSKGYIDLESGNFQWNGQRPHEWVKKLKDRYEESKKEKDYKAWMNAEDRYKENISELMRSGFYFIDIDNVLNYDLEKIIQNALVELIERGCKWKELHVEQAIDEINL